MEEKLANFQVAVWISIFVVLVLLFLVAFLTMYCLRCRQTTPEERQNLLLREETPTPHSENRHETAAKVPRLQPMASLEISETGGVTRQTAEMASPTSTAGVTRRTVETPLTYSATVREVTLRQTAETPPTSTAEVTQQTVETPRSSATARKVTSKRTEETQPMEVTHQTAEAEELEAPRPAENCEPTLKTTAGNEWLSTENFREVFNAVWDARLNWYELGVQLGLRMVQLNVIRRENRDDTKECFMRMIQAWLNQVGATWKELISALKHESVGYIQLANSITAGKTIEQETTADTGEPASSTMTAQHITMRTIDPKNEPLYSDSTDTTDLSFEHLNTSNLTPKESRKLKARLRKDTRCIVTHFSDLVIHMRKSFKQRNIDPRDLATTVKGIAPRETLTRSLNKCITLPAVTSIDTLVDQLQDENYISFINYHLVEYMITHYGTEKDKMFLEAYETRFKEYCRRSVFEVPQDVFGSIPSDGEKLAFKVREEVVKCLPSNSTRLEDDDIYNSASDIPTAQESSKNLDLSLGAVLFIQEKVSETLGLDIDSLVLLGASRGCVELTFSAPKVIMEKVEAKFDVSGSAAVLSNLEAKGIYTLCGPPGKPQATKLRNDCYRLHWTKPKYQGLYPILRYKIHYRSLHDAPKVWRTLETKHDTESIVLPNEIRPEYETPFIFKVQAVTHIGSGIDSEDSGPVMIQPSSVIASDTPHYYTFPRSSKRKFNSPRESNPLTNDNWADIMYKLHPAKEEWYDIGLKLELEQTTLDELKCKYKTSDSCLRHMLIVWLSRKDATREVLISSLNDLGLHDLSNSIGPNASVAGKQV